MRQAMPLAKTPQFNNISDWTLFKKKLITEFAGISIFVPKHTQFLTSYLSTNPFKNLLKI